MSEIDDIFASKGKAKAKAAPPPDFSVTAEKKKKKKKDKKKKPRAAPALVELKGNPASTKKRPLPETIVDPSVLPASAKRPRTDANAAAFSKRPKIKKDAKEKEQVRDSRGTRPSKHPVSFLSTTVLIKLAGRRTEEGWNIYKEDELRLGPEGGGKLPNSSYFTVFTRLAQPHLCVHLTAIVVSRPCLNRFNRIFIDSLQVFDVLYNRFIRLSLRILETMS